MLLLVTGCHYHLIRFKNKKIINSVIIIKEFIKTHNIFIFPNEIISIKCFNHPYSLEFHKSRNFIIVKRVSKKIKKKTNNYNRCKKNFFFLFLLNLMNIYFLL